MVQRTAVIVNPHSAGGRTKARWPQLAVALREHLGAFEALFTEYSGHGTALARAALQNGVERVVSVGGDGTHSEVVNGFFHNGDPLSENAEWAIVPTGTGGDLRRTLGLPASPTDAIRWIGTDLRDIDVGHLQYTLHSGEPAERHFINILSCGLSGRVAHELDQGAKAFGGQLSFAMAALRATAGYRNQPVRLTYVDEHGEEQRIERTIYTLALANAQYFGGGMHVAPDAVMNDGLLDVVIMGDMGWIEVIRGMVKVFGGRHMEEAKVEQFRARTVQIAPLDGVPLYLDSDGEQPGRLPARLSLLHRAIKVSVGPDARGILP